MGRSPYTVVLFGALLVVVTVLGAGSALAATVDDGPGTPHSVTTENDTVGRLVVPDGTTTGAEATPDLSGTLAGEQEQVKTSLETGHFENAFESAENRSAREAVVDETLDRLEEKVTTLQDDREAVIQAYAEGEATSAELFSELTRLRAAAQGTEERAASVETVVQDSSTMSLSDDATAKLAGIDGELVTLRGPITSRLGESIRASAAPTSVGVTGSEGGSVLTVIDGESLLREATRWSERADSGPNRFEEGDSSPLSRAYQEAQEAYPWAVENLVSGLSVTGFGESTIYGVQLTHSHGDLETYLDGRTTNVFHEVQTLRLSSLPTEQVATNTTENLSIEVNETAVGPNAVTVRNETTGERVIADVSVETESRSRSTIASQLWLLETNEERTITARRPGGATVSITITV